METATVSLENFLDDLLPALFSFDENTIRCCLSEYNISATEDNEDFWHTVCGILYDLAVTPPDIKKRAEAWLLKHGFLKYSNGKVYKGR
jgi:hypothetical protein